MKKIIKELLLVEIAQLNHDTFKLVLESDECLPEIIPGQFVNIDVNKSKETFLRRPFSILDVDSSNRRISLLIKILGRASRVLTTYQVGDKISVVFPLGNGFTLPKDKDVILLIGGGSGVAPMLNLAKKCNLPRQQVHLLLGARSKKDHIDSSWYNQFGTIYQTTEDGSLGDKGYVTDHSIFAKNLSNFDKIYTCGPKAMMQAICAKSKDAAIFCEASLENMMACGFGVCLCCVEKTTLGNRCVCSEGPIFNVNELTW
ncbi:MAG: dihydroorotate dehydrogenase electron transfer subunit [Mangrovibacterium sp.]